MNLVAASDFTPGHTYVGTAEGPAELTGVPFTVTASRPYTDPDDP